MPDQANTLDCATLQANSATLIARLQSLTAADIAANGSTPDKVAQAISLATQAAGACAGGDAATANTLWQQAGNVLLPPAVAGTGADPSTTTQPAAASSDRMNMWIELGVGAVVLAGVTTAIFFAMRTPKRKADA